MYLLDTNVVSELRKATSPRIDQRVLAWSRNVSTASLYVSVVTILELERGVLLVARRDPAQAAILRRWLDENLLDAFTDRVIPIDTAVARRCGGLHVPDPRPERDALIAASALVHGMTVVTRNVGDFEPMGVATINPWREAA